MKCVRPSVRILRSEGVHAIVSPVAQARELSDRHQFDCRDAEISQISEVRDERVERAFLRVRADVKLVEDAAFQGDAFPITIPPSKRSCIHNLRWAVYALRLKT